MWNAKKSVILSKVCVIVFIVLLSSFIPALPWVLKYLGLSSYRSLLMITAYCAYVPALLILIDLYKTLQRISKNDVFVPANVAGLRRISWYCMLGAAIFLVTGIFYSTLLILAVAAVFMGLIVRVVKNVFAQAVLLQEEVDGTI